MKYFFLLIVLTMLSSCRNNEHSNITFRTTDTDFSKGRLGFEQVLAMEDLEKFHGHLCDGLVVGALAIKEAMKILYPDSSIDRTNTRIVSKPSPCLTDVAIYLTGGRYQYNSFYVAENFDGLYIIQRIDNKLTVSVSLKDGVKPPAIDSLGTLAINQVLSPCGIDSLRKLEDDFSDYLFETKPAYIFETKIIDNFTWNPILKNDYIKTDILNKNIPLCE